MGSSTAVKYVLCSILRKFSKHVSVLSLHWLKSSTDKRFSTNTTVNVSLSDCDFTNVTNSSPLSWLSAGKKLGLKDSDRESEIVKQLIKIVEEAKKMFNHVINASSSRCVMGYEDVGKLLMKQLDPSIKLSN